MVPQRNDRIRRINEIEFEIPDEKQDLVHPYGTSTIPLVEYEKGLPSIPENIFNNKGNTMFKLRLGKYVAVGSTPKRVSIKRYLEASEQERADWRVCPNSSNILETVAKAVKVLGNNADLRRYMLQEPRKN